MMVITKKISLIVLEENEKRVKNLGLLSFGEEEEELLRDDEKIPGASGGIKSLQSSKFIGKARRKEKGGGGKEQEEKSRCRNSLFQ